MAQPLQAPQVLAMTERLAEVRLQQLKQLYTYGK
jgi:hypothetical protein